VQAKLVPQVWLKSDLRVDDHPGLHLASKAERVVPVFCFDPRLHTQLLRTPNGLEGELLASLLVLTLYLWLSLAFALLPPPLDARTSIGCHRLFFGASA